MAGTLSDRVLHLDTHLGALAASQGTLVHVLLFAVIFIETGIVILPFLPGDSLLFVAGALAAQGTFGLPVLVPRLIAAAIAASRPSSRHSGRCRSPASRPATRSAAPRGWRRCWVPATPSATCPGSAST